MLRSSVWRGGLAGSLVLLVLSLAPLACRRHALPGPRAVVPEERPSPPSANGARLADAPAATSGGRERFTPSSSPPVSLSLAEARLWGQGQSGEMVEVALRGRPASRFRPLGGSMATPSGYEARCVGPVIGRGTVRGDRWSTELAAEGRLCHPLPGQTLVITRHHAVGPLQVDCYAVPGVGLRFAADASRLDGHVREGRLRVVHLELAAHRSVAAKWAKTPGVMASPEVEVPPWRHSVIVGRDGRFAAGPFDRVGLAPGRVFTLTLVGADGLTLVMNRQAPWLRVLLDSGEIAGSGEPLSLVEATLWDAHGRPVARGLGRSDGRGAWHVKLRTPEGERRPLCAGEELEVDAGDGAARLVLPPVTVRWQEGASQLEGQAPASSRIELTAWSRWNPRPTGVSLVARSDGSWHSQLGVQLQPGSGFCATVALHEGQSLVRCERVAQLAIEPGHSRLRLEAAAWVSTTLGLWRDGRWLASASVRTDGSGTAQFQFLDRAGAPLAVQAGDRIRGTVDRQTVELLVPRFEAWPMAGGIRGVASPKARVFMEADRTQRQVTFADADGRFWLPWPADRSGTWRPAEGSRRFQVWAVTAEGHLVGSRFGPPAVVVDLDQAEVRGEAQPGLPVRWSSALAAGQSVTADALPATSQVPAAAPSATPPDHAVVVPPGGSFSVRLPTPLAPGMAWSLWIGATAVRVVVPPLRVDYDMNTGMAAGRGPAGELLTLAVRLGTASDADEHHVVVSDNGTWQLDLAGEPGLPLAYRPTEIRRLELRWQDGAGTVYQRAWRRPAAGLPSPPE